jgi:hypothetical protein
MNLKIIKILKIKLNLYRTNDVVNGEKVRKIPTVAGAVSFCRLGGRSACLRLL